MSIEPDFTIGENQDAPTHVVLVTSLALPEIRNEIMA